MPPSVVPTTPNFAKMTIILNPEIRSPRKSGFEFGSVLSDSDAEGCLPEDYRNLLTSATNLPI